MFPPVAQSAPIRGAGRRLPAHRVEGEEAPPRALELEVFEPEIIDRMREQPIAAMHRDQRQERRGDEPERHAAPRQGQHQRKCQEESERLRKAAEREARIVDRLHGEIL
jgi:hypothetical protein